MGLFLIIERELRLACRRKTTYYARMVAALLVLALSVSMLFAGFAGTMTANSAGRNLFVVLSVASFVFLVFEGTILTADCVSQEKREGTLGLLFLTDLRGWEVILGKLSARTLNSAYCLLATLPAPALAIFLGGVTPWEIAAMMAALVNTLFWAASLGLLVSTLAWREARSNSAALGLSILFGLALPAAGVGWDTLHPGSSGFALISLLSPASMIGAILEPNLGGVPQSTFGRSWWTVHLLGWICLITASWLIPNSWKIGFSPIASWAELAGKPRRSRLLEAGRELNPVFWLGLRSKTRGSAMAWILFGGTVFWLLGWRWYPAQWISFSSFLITLIALHVLLILRFAIESCRMLREDTRTGVLELLLTTPLDLRTLVDGKLLSFKRHGFGAVAFVLGVDAFLAVLAFQKLPVEQAWAWLALDLFLTAQLLVQLYVMSWVGLWQGLVSRTSALAIRRTLFDVVATHWIGFIVTAGLVALCTQGQFTKSPAGAVAGVIWYITLLIATSTKAGAKAMFDLRENLRGHVSANAS